MTTQYSGQISYISAIDAEMPSAESQIDYRSDIVSEFSQKVRKMFRAFLAQDQKLRFVSPAVNMYEILGTEKLEEYRKFFKSVDRYQICASGWNSAHSVTPSDEQIRTAVFGATKLILIGAQAPNAMLLDDGTIGAYWRSGKKYASIDFEVDGEHSWAGTDGENYWSGVWNPADKFPDELKSELKAISVSV